MENLPVYISAVFVLTTLLTVLILYKATNNSKSLLLIATLWLAGQSLLALSLFYTDTNAFPPRLLLVLLPPVLLVVYLIFTSRGRAYLNQFNIKVLTLLHVVRIPVEIVLFWLAVNKVIPTLMTFEGRNFDILAGLTALIIYYFGFVRKRLANSVLLIWNFICLGLLLNIVINGIFSVPTLFQQFAFDQPNIALLYFPFVLLPGFIVPAVLFSHLVTIRQLLIQLEAKTIPLFCPK